MEIIRLFEDDAEVRYYDTYYDVFDSAYLSPGIFKTFLFNF